MDRRKFLKGVGIITISPFIIPGIVQKLSNKDYAPQKIKPEYKGRDICVLFFNGTAIAFSENLTLYYGWDDLKSWGIEGDFFAYDLGFDFNSVLNDSDVLQVRINKEDELGFYQGDCFIKELTCEISAIGPPKYFIVLMGTSRIVKNYLI